MGSLPDRHKRGKIMIEDENLIEYAMVYVGSMFLFWAVYFFWRSVLNALQLKRYTDREEKKRR